MKLRDNKLGWGEHITIHCRDVSAAGYWDLRTTGFIFTVMMIILRASSLLY